MLRMALRNGDEKTLTLITTEDDLEDDPDVLICLPRYPSRDEIHGARRNDGRVAWSRRASKHMDGRESISLFYLHRFLTTTFFILGTFPSFPPPPPPPPSIPPITPPPAPPPATAFFFASRSCSTSLFTLDTATPVARAGDVSG